MAWDLDQFPCLLLVTDLDTDIILECNQYSEELLAIPKENLLNSNVREIFSKASLLFLESYIRPNVMDLGECIEVQVTLKDYNNQRVPVVANIKLKEQHLYWSLAQATKRDRLYEEMLIVREDLEQRTEELIELTRLDPLTNLLNRRAAKSDIETLLS